MFDRTYLLIIIIFFKFCFKFSRFHFILLRRNPPPLLSGAQRQGTHIQDLKISNY